MKTATVMLAPVNFNAHWNNTQLIDHVNWSDDGFATHWRHLHSMNDSSFSRMKIRQPWSTPFILDRTLIYYFFTPTPEISVTQFTIKNKHSLAKKTLSLDDEVEVWRPLQNTINSLNFSVIQKLSRFVCAYMRSRTFQFTENLNTENRMRKFHWNENEVPLFAFHLWHNKSHVSSGCHGSHIAMVKTIGISFSKIEKSRWIYCVENVKYNPKFDSCIATFVRMIPS